MLNETFSVIFKHPANYEFFFVATGGFTRQIARKRKVDERNELNMGRKADEDGTNTGGSKTGFGKVGNFRPILGD